MSEEPNMFDAIKSLAASGDEIDGDFAVNVETYDNGAHHYVHIEAARRGCALEPDDARDLARQILAAADEADRRSGKVKKRRSSLWTQPTTRDGE